MSYAEVASKGPKQTPEEAAAPQPPKVVMSDTASTSSLIDVDTPSVRTVPSDYGDQEVKTETQAARLEREAEAAANKARAEADLAKKKAQGKARKADNWLEKKIGGLSDGASDAIITGNWAAILGVGAWFGYKGYGLYSRGRLGWKEVGIGAGVIGALGVVDHVFRGYVKKTRGKKQ